MYYQVTAKEVIKVLQKICDRGQFFSAKVFKRGTTELREFNGRLGVRKYVRGGGLKFTPEERELITIWDQDAYRRMQKKETNSPYRMINVSDLLYLKAGGQVLIENRHPTQAFLNALNDVETETTPAEN